MNLTCRDWSDFTAEINSEVLSLQVVMSKDAVIKLFSLQYSTRVVFSSPLDLVRRRLVIIGKLHIRCYHDTVCHLSLPMMC